MRVANMRNRELLFHGRDMNRKQWRHAGRRQELWATCTKAQSIRAYTIVAFLTQLIGVAKKLKWLKFASKTICFVLRQKCCWTIGGDLAPSLKGTEKNLQTKIFEWLFLGKNFHFRPKISNDLFLVIDHVFQIFPIFFPYIYCLKCHIWPSFFTRKNPISENNSLMTPFLLYYYCRVHQTTLLLKILGGQIHGPSPTSNFGGDRLPSPS